MPLVTRQTSRVNFTKAKFEALPIPATGRRYVYDLKTPGLAICVSTTGGMVFYLYRKVDGKPERIKIGPYPRTTIEQARDEATRMNGKIAEGQNPNDKRRVNRYAPTLGQVFDEYIEKPTRGKSKRPRSPKTTKDYRWQFKKYLEPWRDRQLSKIKRQDVERLHNEIGETGGHYIANRILALCKAILNYAVEEEYFPLNVATRLRAFEERSRERFVTKEEMPQFWKAIEAEAAADFYKFSLLTGARRGNVLAARWADIDLTQAVWRIPTTKGGHPLVIPLSPKAVEILRARQEKAQGEWVFPRQDGSGRPMPPPRHGWERILKRAGIDDLRIHDLRRSNASWQLESGANETVIGKSLGHSSIQATKIYARADLEAVRGSVDAASAAIMAATKLPEQAKSKRARRKKARGAND